MSNTIDVNTRQSFQIFNDRENNPSLRKIKRENAHNNIPISKRQALSSITNTVRVQSTYNGVTRSKKQVSIGRRADDANLNITVYVINSSTSRACTTYEMFG